ncbi:MAG: cheY [Solirubrobacterales bacterium]|nr:cheY [Solirubrobacterales bacterium]
MPRVFHCDDEPNYRSLVRVVLAQAGAGYEFVGEAADGREALDLAPGLKPDILLLDVNMPGMGGIEALPHLRAALPDTKIVALTTSWRSAWEEHFRKLGGDGYIEKPRDAFALPALLEAALSEDAVDPLDVAEEMFHAWWAEEPERSWATFAPDAEFTLVTTPGTIVGVDAMRAHVASIPEARRGSARAIKMIGLHDTVVIEATAEMPRDGVRERFPIAWVVRVRDGKIRSVHAYGSWSQGREAAGLTPGVTPTAERDLGLGAGWVFAVARRMLRLPRFARPELVPA